MQNIHLCTKSTDLSTRVFISCPHYPQIYPQPFPRLSTEHMNSCEKRPGKTGAVFLCRGDQWGVFRYSATGHRPPLSLRGGRSPTWQSPGRQYESQRVTRRFPRSLRSLGMTDLGDCAFVRARRLSNMGGGRQPAPYNECPKNSRIPYAERKLATNRASPKDVIQPPDHQNELAPGPARYAERKIATSRASPKDVIQPPDHQNELPAGASRLICRRSCRCRPGRRPPGPA